MGDSHEKVFELAAEDLWQEKNHNRVTARAYHRVGPRAHRQVRRPLWEEPMERLSQEEMDFFETQELYSLYRLYWGLMHQLLCQHQRLFGQRAR